MTFLEHETADFDDPNPWGVTTRRGSALFASIDDILLAAITVGYNRVPQWLSSSTSLALISEIYWKLHSTLTLVRSGSPSLSRWIPTEHALQLDPSEKTGLNYQLGMTLAQLCCERRFGVGNLVHLDLYREALGIELPQDESRDRPDLVGWHPVHGWVVVECKGRSSYVDAATRDKAKTQAQRVVSIGGETPILHLAFFSYFGQRKASPSGKVIKTLLVDPEFDDKVEDPIKLEVTHEQHLEVFYQPFSDLFSERALAKKSADNDIVYRKLEDADVKIGIDRLLLEMIEKGAMSRVSEYLQVKQPRKGMHRRVRGAFSNGLQLKVGDEWKKLIPAAQN